MRSGRGGRPGSARRFEPGWRAGARLGRVPGRVACRARSGRRAGPGGVAGSGHDGRTRHHRGSERGFVAGSEHCCPRSPGWGFAPGTDPSLPTHESSPLVPEPSLPGKTPAASLAPWPTAGAARHISLAPPATTPIQDLHHGNERGFMAGSEHRCLRSPGWGFAAWTAPSPPTHMSSLLGPEPSLPGETPTASLAPRPAAGAARRPPYAPWPTAGAARHSSLAAPPNSQGHGQASVPGHAPPSVAHRRWLSGLICGPILSPDRRNQRIRPLYPEVESLSAHTEASRWIHAREP